MVKPASFYAAPAIFLLANTIACGESFSQVRGTLSNPLSEPNEIQRWTKSLDTLNSLTKSNWRDFLKTFTDHTIKTGASFDEHRSLAITRIGEVAGKDALDLWRKEEEPTGKFDTCWRGMVGFAVKDPAGAQKWWGALPEGELKKQLVGSMTWGLSQAGEPEVSKFFLAAPDWVQQKVGMDAVKALEVNYGFEASAMSHI